MAYGWWKKATKERLVDPASSTQQYAVGEGFRVIGTPGQVADVMEHWMDTGAADGFNITPTHLPGGIDDFVGAGGAGVAAAGTVSDGIRGGDAAGEFGVAGVCEPLGAVTSPPLEGGIRG